MPSSSSSRQPAAAPKRQGAIPRRRRWVFFLTLLVLAGAAAVYAAASGLGASPAAVWRSLSERSTMDLVRYAEQRLVGHPTLEGVLLPLLANVRQRLEREPPAALRDLGKGQRPQGLSSALFEANGMPMPATLAAAAVSALPADRVLGSTAEIAKALADATPGQVLEIAPGSYALDGTLRTGRAGSFERPITLRARQPGTVTLRVSTTEGIVVSQPFWVFENLGWVGACARDEDCDHAFHVVGQARGTVIRNNRITDFNAHIKINGDQDAWPDGGLVQFCTLENSRPRQTGLPVVPVDLVGASRWQLLDNRVTNIVKAGGDGVSYGLFMKGAGRGGRIERNVVVCTPRGMSQPGLRVGISIGGGGTGAVFCRDLKCTAEHHEATVANNVVAHCNDAGIDVAQAQGTLVIHNTLINTQGVLLRRPPADATVVNNLLEGAIRSRQDTQVRSDGNQLAGRLSEWLTDADALDLRWRELPPTVAASPAAPLDFCARPRPQGSPPGATLAASC